MNSSTLSSFDKKVNILHSLSSFSHQMVVSKRWLQVLVTGHRNKPSDVNLGLGFTIFEGIQVHDVPIAQLLKKEQGQTSRSCSILIVESATSNTERFTVSRWCIHMFLTA